MRRWQLDRLVVGAAAIGPWLLTAQRVAAHGQADPAPDLGVVTTWLGAPLPWLGALIAAVAYLVAVRRVNRRHPRSPVSIARVAAWLAGLALILVALESAVDVYADDLLTVHMVQHVLLTLVAAPLLALGAPVTLLLRVANAPVRQRFLLPLLHSRFVRYTAFPAVAWLVFAAVMIIAHFSPLYDLALENPLIHDSEHFLFLASGALFWWPVVAADPVPNRMRHGGRLVYLGAMVPLASAVGLAIYFAGSTLYDHYATLDRAWGPSALVDQQIGGLIMWAVGDVILMLAFALVVADWMRADARRTLIGDAARREARRRLEDVQRREQEQPHGVDEMPVVADGLDGGVTLG